MRRRHRRPIQAAGITPGRRMMRRQCSSASMPRGSLMSRGLVEPKQRPDLPGQPFEYRTTTAFLQHFGIRSLSDLPDLSGPDGSDLGQALSVAVEEAQRAEPELELAGAMIQHASMGELANP